MPKPANASRFALIMAGGRGERFWPLSRESRPKQLLKLLGERSLLQQTIDRVLPLVGGSYIFIITTAAQLKAVRAQLPELPADHVIAEPVGRDTCAAVALGAAIIGACHSQGVMAVLAADHVIPNGKHFRRVLRDCYTVATRGDRLITLGIQPSEPATGYGYLELGAPIQPMIAGKPRPKPLQTRFFQVARYVEKPSREKAEEYLASGRFRWNAGMFVWSVDAILEALRAHQTGMHVVSQRWKAAFSVGGMGELRPLLACDYPALPKISVDYAIMERASNVVAAEADFVWDDLGSWTALLRHLPGDAAGNAALGEMLQVDSTGNLIIDARRRKTPIALLGLRDTILVHTDDAVFALAKDQAQRVKEVVIRLAADPRFKHLL